MKTFYTILLAFYGMFFWWYGGFSAPITDHELDAYIEQLQAAVEETGEDASSTVKYMRNLAASDQGGEFLMVNLMDFRDVALYPADSPWANDPDALAADARYSEKVVPLLLKRGSHPVLIGPLTGTFIIEGQWGAWDNFAIIRYRSVRDMMEMMIEMAELDDVVIHKWASMEKTQVFPIKPMLALPGLRLLVALFLIVVAVGVTAIVRLRQGKQTQ